MARELLTSPITIATTAAVVVVVVVVNRTNTHTHVYERINEFGGERRAKEKGKEMMMMMMMVRSYHRSIPFENPSSQLAIIPNSREEQRQR